MFGGGMRQAGIIAAGALYALENHRQRLVEDHANARLLAQRLSQLPGVQLDVSSVETNIVIIRLRSYSPASVVEKLGQQGIGVMVNGSDRIRAVTSLAVTREDVLEAADAFEKALT